MRIFAVLFALLLTIPSAAFAIKINEMMYNPPSSTDAYDEWIEIWNDGSSAVDLTGWKLCNSPLKAGYIAYGSKTMKPTHDTGMSLPANGYAIVTDGMSGSTVLENFTVADGALLIHVDAGSMCGGLNNGGDTVILTSTSGVADNVTYTDIAASGYSIERDSSGWLKSASIGGTPGYANSIVQQPNQPEQPQQQQNNPLPSAPQAPQNQQQEIAPPPVSLAGNAVITIPNAPREVEAGSGLELKFRLFSNFSVVKIYDVSAYAFSGQDLATEGGWNPGTYKFVLDPKQTRTESVHIGIRPDIKGTFTLRVKATDGNSTWSADAPLTVVLPEPEVVQTEEKPVEKTQPGPSGAFTFNIDLNGILGQLMTGLLSRITEFFSNLKFQGIVSG